MRPTDRMSRRIVVFSCRDGNLVFLFFKLYLSDAACFRIIGLKAKSLKLVIYSKHVVPIV